jgi:hypothetical protein
MRGLEARLEVESRELFRQLLQDHLDLRAQRERRLEEVVGADSLPRGSAEAGHQRGLATVLVRSGFGGSPTVGAGAATCIRPMGC